jgi:hypothetical protein
MTFERHVFFTKVPLTGYFRYKDEFQIFPLVGSNIPTSKHQQHFPAIIEFTVKPDENPKVGESMKELMDLMHTTSGALPKFDRILGLLTGISNYLFFRYDDINSSTWAIPVEYDAKENFIKRNSAWCTTGFYTMEKWTKDLPKETFTEPKFDPIEAISHDIYFTHDPVLAEYEDNALVKFPDSLNNILDKYFRLDSETQRIIDNAISYNESAVELRNKRPTVSLLASFTSMETMVNLEFKDFKAEKCKECGQPMYSISKKFKTYMTTYISNTEGSLKKFNAYYTLRSKIVHTGRRLNADRLFDEVPTEVYQDERKIRNEVLQLGRLAIANWLLKS